MIIQQLSTDWQLIGDKEMGLWHTLTGVRQPLMPRKTSYFDQTCKITWYHLNMTFTLTIRISRRFSSAWEFQMRNFQKYWSQNVGQDFIVLDFFHGRKILKAGGRDSQNREHAYRSQTTFDAEENFLFRSNVQWIHLGLSCYGLFGTKADQSIILGLSSRME
jgi:hypothetical protein